MCRGRIAGRDACITPYNGLLRQSCQAPALHLCRGCWAEWRHVGGTGQMPWQLGACVRFSAPQGTLKDTWLQAQAIGTDRGQGRQGPACMQPAHQAVGYCQADPTAAHSSGCRPRRLQASLVVALDDVDAAPHAHFARAADRTSMAGGRAAVVATGQLAVAGQVAGLAGPRAAPALAGMPPTAAHPAAALVAPAPTRPCQLLLDGVKAPSASVLSHPRVWPGWSAGDAHSAAATCCTASAFARPCLTSTQTGCSLAS